MAELARQRLALLRPEAAKNKPVTRKTLAQFLKEDAPTYEAFCSCLEVKTKKGERVPFVLNRVQRRYAASRTWRDIVLKARQQGFTTEALARDLWHFLTHPGACVRIICQSSTDHGPLNDISAKLRSFIESLRDRGVLLPFATEANARWALEDGRDLVILEAGASEAAAQKKGRAGTITRLHCTELAYWEYAGQTLNAILECVPTEEDSGSEIQFESTANGAAPDVEPDKRDILKAAGAALFHWFYQDAKAERNGFRAHFFEWHQTEEYATPLAEGETVEARNEQEAALLVAGVTLEQLKWRHGKLDGGKSTDTFDQEYPHDDTTCFLLSGRGFFDAVVIRSLLLRAREPLEVIRIKAPGADGELRIFRRAEPACDYCAAADTSEGTGGDPAAVIVREFRTARHMATLHGQFKPWELARALAGICLRYSGALAAVERNNHGGTVLRCLSAEQHYGRIFFDRDEKPGWITGPASRPQALATFEQALREGEWETLDKVVLTQLRTFVYVDIGDGRARVQAASGAHDDLVMAEAICWDVLCRPLLRRSARGVSSL